MDSCIYENGKIFTSDRDSLYGEAMLVEGGLVRKVGTREEVEEAAPEGCARVDLGGRRVLPGFVDAHSHFFQVATSMLQVSLNGARSPEEMGQRIRDYISREKVQPGEWVIARDYDHNLLPQYQHPTLEQLNSFAPENPLIIHHKSGHMGLMNWKALDLLEITPETPDPEGGIIGREDGKLTGYL